MNPNSKAQIRKRLCLQEARKAVKRVSREGREELIDLLEYGTPREGASAVTKKVLSKQLRYKRNVLKVLKMVEQMVLNDIDKLEGWSITDGPPPSFFDLAKENRREVLEGVRRVIKEVEDE